VINNAICGVSSLERDRFSKRKSFFEAIYQMSILSIFSGRSKTNARGNHTFSLTGGRRRGDPQPVDVQHATSAIPEDHFHRMLWREQKRSERSQKQLLLMTIGVQTSPGTKDDVRLLHRAVDCVTKSVRDTDLVGWSEANAVFVVLFTELGDIEVHAASRAIQTKVMGCLQKSFPGNQLNKISVSFNPFPQQWESEAKKGTKYAWDTRRDSDRSVVAGISGVPRDCGCYSHPACGGSDTADTAFRERQIVTE
jgi:hypothetical protein